MRQAIAILQSISDDSESKRLYVLDRLFSCRAVHQDTVKLIDLGYPTAVFFLFKFDC